MKVLKKILVVLIGLLVFFFLLGLFSSDNSESQEIVQTQIETTVSESETTVEEKTKPESENENPAEALEESESVENTASVSADSIPYTALDFYTILEDNGVAPYTLNEKAIQFLTDHDDFFPLDIEGGAEITEETIDYSIEARHISKNEEKYGDKLMMLPPAQVRQIKEIPVDDNHYLTTLNIYDYDGQQYYVIYKGELEDIFDDDVVNVIGLPLGFSHFDNTAGGQTLVVVLAGCQITGEEPTG